MTPEQFIALWKNNPLTERAGAQAHFDDLCDCQGNAGVSSLAPFAWRIPPQYSRMAVSMCQVRRISSTSKSRVSPGGNGG